VAYDLPIGAGLATSSAYTVGLLRACSVFEAETIAKLAIVWERDKLEGNIGYQDQYICSLGGFHLMRFFPSGISDYKVEYQDDFSSHIMLVDTCQYRQAGKIIADQLRRIEDNTTALLELKEMAKEGCVLIENGKYKDFGQMMTESWKLKKSLSKGITTDETDRIFSKGIKAGAWGGKLLGAGGGGFICFIVPPEKKGFIRKALELKDIEVKVENEGSKIIFADNT
jgi:D-glycero-alpha-D-manno-heptose-7-phosphate kinase